MVYLKANIHMKAAAMRVAADTLEINVDKDDVEGFVKTVQLINKIYQDLLDVASSKHISSKRMLN